MRSTKEFLRVVVRLVSGQHFREARSRRAQYRAEQSRIEQERERERLAAARREAEALAARHEEDRQRFFAEQRTRNRASSAAEQRAAEARRQDQVAAEKEAAEEKAARVEAYLKWQDQIGHRDEKQRIRAIINAPDEIEPGTSDGSWNYSNRGLFGRWRRTSKGWRKG